MCSGFFFRLQIVIVIKSRSTPCTLEKRYEANSREERLPSTFVDGTDKPGADETVSLRFVRNEQDNTEKVEIYMKYIATQLVVRRVGRYLTFAARLPDDVISSSASYSDPDGGGAAKHQGELCTNGCPAGELLGNIAAPPRFRVDREQALQECRNAITAQNLTGAYLEWCAFDLMSAGLSYDFITAAHVAQADALSMDPSVSLNGTEERSLWWSGGGGAGGGNLDRSQPSSTGAAQRVSTSFFSLAVLVAASPVTTLLLLLLLQRPR